MEDNGLKRKRTVWNSLCDVRDSATVFLADQFAEIFDGLSIWFNDLTQLTLDLTRNSSEIVADFSMMRNDAVKRFIAEAIKNVKKHGRKIGICGQAPSDFPDFAQFLVECGIDSISLNPDTVIKTRMKIAEKEKALKK
jgi:pyruvate,water dikinase